MNDSQHGDFGVYQIYGTHAISGPNTLLYIGKADQQTFAERLTQHKHWMKWESSTIEIYIGKIGGTDKDYKDLWSQEISHAEQLLIYFCTPPYNSQNIKSYGDIKDTIVLNFDKTNRLPLQVSTYYEESNFWDES